MYSQPTVYRKAGGVWRIKGLVEALKLQMQAYTKIFYLIVFARETNGAVTDESALWLQSLSSVRSSFTLPEDNHLATSIQP